MGCILCKLNKISNLILQWGTINTNNTIKTFNFPIAYSKISITSCIRANTNAGCIYGIVSSLNNFSVIAFNMNDNITTYISIGY